MGVEVKSDLHTYVVGKNVGEAEKFRLYLCTQMRSEKQHMLQIATSVGYNGALDRSAYILRTLKQLAFEVEEEYSRVKTDPKGSLNYDLGFPQLEDSFIWPEQDNRRINILSFKNVDDLGNLVPLANITQIDQMRIDLRTSVMVLGKLLKTLVFTQSEGVSVGGINGNNVLVEPHKERRYVIVFDFSDAAVYPPGSIPMEIRRDEISKAAQTVIICLGGDPETGFIPNDGEEAFAPYSNHLFELARGTESRASQAHRNFYELADSLWGKSYYPFTIRPLA